MNVGYDLGLIQGFGPGETGVRELVGIRLSKGLLSFCHAACDCSESSRTARFFRIVKVMKL